MEFQFGRFGGQFVPPVVVDGPVLEKFSNTLFNSEWIVKIEDINENLASHRQQNYIGEILHHHSLQSTKYMAKWIEEKGKG